MNDVTADVVDDGLLVDLVGGLGPDADVVLIFVVELEVLEVGLEALFNG